MLLGIENEEKQMKGFRCSKTNASDVTLSYETFLTSLKNTRYLLREYLA